MKKNIILLADSYKQSHHLLYNKGMTKMYSYGESRGGKWPEVVMFGLQYILKEYFTGEIVNNETIAEAEDYLEKHFGRKVFNKEGWQRIVDVHGGRLPVEIKAVPEGSVVPVKNILLSIENTDTNIPWITNFLETALSWYWYGSTVATSSREIMKVIKHYLVETGGDVAGLPFKLHNFSYRGCSSYEQSGIGDVAHLAVGFMGSDNLSGLMFAREYYGADCASYSVVASEHSVMSQYGRNGEERVVEEMLNNNPTGILSCVADTYDIYNFCNNIIGKKFKEKILARDGVFVVRPDCYDDKTEIFTEKGWKKFNQLTTDLKVAQYTNDGFIEFVKPLKIINQHYKGKMITLNDQKGKVDLVITPNHRVVIKDNNKNVLITEIAENVKFYHNKNLIRTGFKKEGRSNLTSFERFKIAFQADGAYPSGGPKENDGINCGYIKVRFTFTKQRKIDRLIKICNDAKLKYNICDEPARKNQKIIYVELDKYPEKTFKWVNFMEINGDWCRDFIEEVSHWDACRRSNTRFKYDTTLKENSDVVYDIAMLAGYSAVYSLYEDNRKVNFDDVHTINILTNKNEVNGQAIIKDEIDYDGTVGCVQVPSGMILVRRNNKFVISGNSGHPPSMVLDVHNMLGEAFGYTVNNAGYAMLNSKLGVLQGDGIDYNTVVDVCENLKINKWSTNNLLFGSGGGLLVADKTRDTCKFAIKASWAIQDGQEIDIYKDPITDQGKQSKRGRLKLIKENGQYKTVKQSEAGQDLLVPVFKNGEILNSWTLDEIRERAKI